jgi:hypothetical protein
MCEFSGCTPRNARECTHCLGGGIFENLDKITLLVQGPLVTHSAKRIFENSNNVVGWVRCSSWRRPRVSRTSIFSVLPSPINPTNVALAIMSSILKKPFKHLSSVVAIRKKREHPQEVGTSTSQEVGTSTSHRNLPTTGPPEKVSPNKPRRSEGVDIIELVSPMVQAVAGAIPVAGPPLKAAIEGLLYIIQITDVGLF